MASYFSLHFPHLISRSKSIRSDNKRKRSIYTSRSWSWKFKEQRKSGFFGIGLLFRCYILPRRSTSSSSMLLSASSSASVYSSFAQSNSDSSDDETEAKPDTVESNRIDCLVWVLHESSRSFSLAVEALKLTGSGSELSMAWVGKDVHEWHKRISYMVAVYALLKTAIDMEVLLSHERNFNNSSPVTEILTPKINLVGEYIKNRLNSRHPSLGEWFRDVELPRVTSLFIPLLKKWSMKYAGSGVAGIIVAISCCVAVGKLGPGRITCPSFTFTIEDVMVQFLDSAYSLVSVEKLHHLSTKAGFELDFLNHFGRKVIPCKKSEELEFWIGLAHRKLSIAFHKETLISEGRAFPQKAQADTLATLGLFAYLGKRTRLFLSAMGIKDLDEPVRDFLSYLECGSIFVYQEFSSISVYQSFMEVVTDEIGWLDFFDTIPSTSFQDRRRSKQHCLQAEKEIVLSTVFTTAYDVISGFAHFTRSTQQLLDSSLLSFLLESQKLLAFLLEDYWAVYGKSRELLNFTETNIHDPKLSSINARGVAKSPVEMVMNGCPSEVSPPGLQVTTSISLPETGTVNSRKKKSVAKSNPLHKSLLNKYTVKLVAASSDVWMGTQLLWVDVQIALELLSKQLHDQKMEKRERSKLKRTISDIGLLIPITVLMLLPVSAVGHAAILAAINQYMPSLIPSPYSTERLDVMKQLERTKKMEQRIQHNYDDQISNV